MKLNSQYNKFYDAQLQLKESSRKLLYRRLLNLPAPDDLTKEWFQKRVKAIAPSTARYDKTIILQVLEFLKRHEQAEIIKSVKLPRVEATVTVEDLYTQEELNRIFAVPHNTRDRALLQVLYESACRISELLSMTFKNTSLHDDGTASIIVSGKTGTRQIPLFHSVPMLRDWLNVHPSGKERVWVSLRSPYNPMPRPRVYTMVAGTLEKAKVKDKKRIIHMFRHTRITELVKLGIRGPSLWKLVGWKSGKMELVYIHLSTEDVENEMRSKVFGLEVDESHTQPNLEHIDCIRCGYHNEPQARYCSKCNTPIGKEAILQALDREKDTFDGFADFLRELKDIEPNIVKDIMESMNDIQKSLDKAAKRR